MKAKEPSQTSAVPAADLSGRVVAFGKLVRFSHTVFAMPFALMACFLAARGLPEAGKLVLVLLCMVTARSAAMTFNRIADAAIDAKNPRTARRPIQTGQIAPRQAWAFYGMCCGGFVAACWGFYTLYGNVWPLALSAPVLAFISAYSYTKRFTSLCHIWLGASLGLSPPAVWLALSPATFGLSPLVLGLSVLCWVGGFDIIYSLQDLEFDRRERLYSLPSRLGPSAALWISRVLHLATVALLVWLGMLQNLRALYWTGVALSAALLATEQAMVSPRNWRRAGAAFTYANAIMSLALATFLILDVLTIR